MKRVSMIVALACAALAAGQALAVPGDPATRPLRIFFNWNAPDLVRDDEAVLVAAVADWRASADATLRIDGHSDRSGPAAANLAGSRKRASQVRDRLIALGVPADSIRVVAYGEALPLIPTEDGVREVQNRRVDIWLIPPAVESGVELMTAQLVDAAGTAVGEVKVTIDARGATFTVTTTGMMAGARGLHLHDKGMCEGPKFESAGRHWNPGAKMHGKDNPAGAHLGDLDNIDGARATASVAGVRVSGGVNDLADANGTSLVIHARADDYMTDPSGNSGDRIACAVLAPPKGD